MPSTDRVRCEMCVRRSFLPVSVVLLISAALQTTSASAQEDGGLAAEVDRLARQVMPKVVTWRRDVHQNPELGNREVRTSELVANHLRSLGMEVKTGVAHTGVVAVLR